MAKEIPKISFKENQSLNIEVMNFNQLAQKLNESLDHNPYHFHKINFFFIIILTDKSYTHFVDFKPYVLKRGSALFIAKNQIHRFTNELQNAKGICLGFNSQLFDKFLFLSDDLKFYRLFNYHIETPIIHQHEMNNDNFIDLANQIYDEFVFPNQFAKTEFLCSLLQVLFLKAERVKANQSIQGIKTSFLVTFSTFKNMLEKDYVNSRSSRSYASKLFISYKYLNDIVKKLTGKTVKAFIDDFVIIEIKRHLVSTSLSVNEVSYKTGFEEPANMVKYFKKHTGKTPHKFRNSL